MVDLELVLRRYGDDLDKRCPPVTPARLERHLEALTSDNGQPGISDLPVTPEESRTGYRGRFRLAITGVAAAVVLLVVLIVAGGDNGPESQTFTDAPPDTQPTLEPPPEQPSDPNPSTAPEAIDWDAYFAEIADSSRLLSEEPVVYQLLPGPEPQFDTSALGTEIVLEPVSGGDFLDFDELFATLTDPDEQVTPENVLFVGQVPDDGFQFAVFRAEGICTAQFLSGDITSVGCDSGRSYGFSSDGTAWGMNVFVPVDSSVVAITTLEGERLWQRPNGGWAVFDTPPWPEGGPFPAIVAYDAAGNPIGRWGSSQTELDAWAQSHPRPIADESLALVEAYFDAYNSGDLDAVLSLLPDQFGGVLTRDGYGLAREQRFFLDSAQGTILRSSSCTAADGRSGGDTVVTCVYDILDAPTQAVNATPVSATAAFTVSENGITDIEDSFGDVDFSHVREPFLEWLPANRLSATCLNEMLEGQTFLDCFADEIQEPERFGNVDEWAELGLLVAQYAEEWAAYLELNGCSYLDGC